MDLPQKIAFVDLETTGGRLFYDRIIEVGIVILENGQVSKKYSSLVNPQKYLPPEIVQITGIQDKDLEDAPTFSQIKDRILELLDGCVFVAHNVRFDYGFLKSEFKRFDFTFSTKHFCTVKLSRTLFPQFPRHNLDALIERFKFDCSNRHRALDDAQVICDFYQLVTKQFSPKVVEEALSLALKKPSIPIHIKPQVLDGLPEAPGVYIFYGENNLPLYVGKSINIKERVMSHFSNDHSSNIEMKISQQIKAIETVRTAGELGALIKEAQLVKRLQPLYNRKLRHLRKLNVLKRAITQEGYQTVSLETITSIDSSQIENIVGIFKTQKSAKEFLINAAKEHRLCEKLLGVENSKTSCFGYRLARCKGACVGKESTALYNLRFILALSKHLIQPWPFDGPVMIKEKNYMEDREETFFIDKWCFLGSIENEGGGFVEQSSQFDLDTYKILHSYLKHSSAKSIQPLSYDSFRSLHEQLSGNIST